MFVLSLILLSAAGVNAILGSNAYTVWLSNVSYFCSEDCVFGGAFFDIKGNWCPENEIVAITTRSTDAIEYGCAGTANTVWAQEHTPKDGEKPDTCLVKNATGALDGCLSAKEFGGKAEDSSRLEWSEVERKLKSIGQTPPPAAEPISAGVADEPDGDC